MGKYYDLNPVLTAAPEAVYYLLYGQRANGKSYQVKKYALERAFNNDEKFIYLRRFELDIKQSNVAVYFDDMPVKEITKGTYEGVTAHHGSIYFYTLDEDGKIIKGKEIGRYCALNIAERYKSQAFVNYKTVIFEEFITDQLYLTDEPRLLQQFISTVARLEKIRVFMIGNTLSRVCPYWAEWCLDGVLKQKQGTIDIYHFHLDDTVIDIAVEYCANANFKNKMFFGNAAKQITSGEWDVHDLPKLPGKQDNYEKVYELLIEYQKFRFVVELLIEKWEGTPITFIYPFTGSRKFDRVITDVFSIKLLTNNQLNTNIKAEQLIQSCFANNKVCYSDNLTGTDFAHVIEAFKMV